MGGGEEHVGDTKVITAATGGRIGRRRHAATTGAFGAPTYT